MAEKRELDYYLAQARRIAEHREEGVEREIRKIYRSMLKELKTYIADVHEQYADPDGKLDFAALQKAGYDARFLEEIEQRIAVASPKAARELHQLVNDTYQIAYESMVRGVVAQGVEGLDETFAAALALTPEQIRRVVDNPVMDLALEKNHRDIIYNIKQAVATGLMNGDRYSTVASRVTELLDADNGAYKRAVRIARTEMHRVREMGNIDAALKVDEELQKGTTGMREVKTWKTMKDERVRPQRRRKSKKGWSYKMGNGPNHIKLDGQTVLASDPFDLLDGHTAMSPGQSGVAGHDINCRCYVSYELMTDEEYHAKTGKHFPGWKGEDKKEPEEPAEKYTRDHDSEIAKRFGTDHYDAMHDMVEACPDEHVAQAWKKYESQIRVGNAHSRGRAYASGSNVYLDIDSVARGNSYERPYQTAFHECGHAIDSLARSAAGTGGSWGARHYSSAYKGGIFPQTIKEEVADLVKARDKELKALFKKHAAAGDVEWFHDNGFLDGWRYSAYKAGTYTAAQVIPKYAKSYAYGAVKRAVKAAGSKYAYGDLSDILEGATGAKIDCGIGHGAKYWKDRTFDGLADGLAAEAFAEMIDSTMACPESLALIKQYLPKSYELFLEMIENLL